MITTEPSRQIRTAANTYIGRFSKLLSGVTGLLLVLGLTIPTFALSPLDRDEKMVSIILTGVGSIGLSYVMVDLPTYRKAVLYHVAFGAFEFLTFTDALSPAVNRAWWDADYGSENTLWKALFVVWIVLHSLVALALLAPKIGTMSLNLRITALLAQVLVGLVWLLTLTMTEVVALPMDPWPYTAPLIHGAFMLPIVYLIGDEDIFGTMALEAIYG